MALKPRITKRKLTNDNFAIAPIVWIVVLIGGAIAGLGVYNVTQRPDITYNITDTGFSIAGVDVSWFVIIGLVGIVIIVFLFMFRRKPQPQQRQPIFIGRDRFQ